MNTRHEVRYGYNDGSWCVAFTNTKRMQREQRIRDANRVSPRRGGPRVSTTMQMIKRRAQ